MTSYPVLLTSNHRGQAMNKFVSTLSNVTHTENLMPTYKSSGNACLDLFYRIGNRKNTATDGTVNLLANAEAALAENFTLAVKIIGWSRSVRDGAGVRENMRSILDKELIPLNKVDFSWFIDQGYWKDIFYFAPDKVRDTVIAMIAGQLEAGSNLAKKWHPRKKKRNPNHKNSRWFMRTRTFMGLSERDFRKILSSYNTVETAMCANNWDKIDYSTVPSVSMLRNKKQFEKHDKERFTEFGAKAVVEAKEGIKSVKAGAIYPHEIAKSVITNGDGWRSKGSVIGNQAAKDIAIAQWLSLPDKFSTDKKILVMGDTSGSMTMGDGDAMYISKSLSVYCAERITGAFHNFCMTFSTTPKFHRFTDEQTFIEKYMSMEDIIADTNIERAMDTILQFSVRNKVPAEDMPDMLLIISDMQFNEGTTDKSLNAQAMFEKQYRNAGYAMPVIVYWNVRNSTGVPVRDEDTGVALFSGASPNSIRQAIEGEMNPVSAMMRVVNREEFYFLIN